MLFRSPMSCNLGLIEGDSGVIVVDTLTSIEGARAAMEGRQDG